jgi:hypothetical protein
MNVFDYLIQLEQKEKLNEKMKTSRIKRLHEVQSSGAISSFAPENLRGITSYDGAGNSSFMKKKKKATSTTSMH